MTSVVPAGPLLRVKRSIPPPRTGAVARDQLERRLDEPNAKLAVVVAPAGWGKTSLLSRWASTAAATTPLAWVSLDENDDEPVRFWRYLLTALREVGRPAQLGRAGRPGGVADTAPTDLALPLLINELAATPNRHVLVLDDYQASPTRGIHESVEFFLSYLPPTLQVVIASRWDPPLPLARMRARGELVELRANDLRFSPDEAAAMVSAVAESPLDDTAASALWERTEGWAAGLQLAGLALRGSRDPSAAAARVRGDDRHLFDYFTSEVIPGLVPAQRDLLIRSAPLELLSGSLCDAALQVEGSAEVLAELERADMFVTVLDGDRDWYRCHRLLRDALQRGPGAPTRAATRAVLGRAARWFVDHGRIDEAVRHLLLAGDDAAAAELLAAHQAWFFDRGWAAAFLQHRRAVGRVRGPARSWRCPCRTQRRSAVTRTGSSIGSTSPNGRSTTNTVIDGWRSARAAALMMRGINGTPAADPAQAVALCEQAVALEQAAGTAVPARALTALGSALRASTAGSTRPPRSWPMPGVDADRASGHEVSISSWPALLAVSLLQLGRGRGGRPGAGGGGAARRRRRAELGRRRCPVVAQLRLAEGPPPLRAR